jgi:hypothetical protein
MILNVPDELDIRWANELLIISPLCPHYLKAQNEIEDYKHYELKTILTIYFGGYAEKKPKTDLWNFDIIQAGNVVDMNLDRVYSSLFEDKEKSKFVGGNYNTLINLANGKRKIAPKKDGKSDKSIINLRLENITSSEGDNVLAARLEKGDSGLLEKELFKKGISQYERASRCSVALNRVKHKGRILYSTFTISGVGKEPRVMRFSYFHKTPFRCEEEKRNVPNIGEIALTVRYKIKSPRGILRDIQTRCEEDKEFLKFEKIKEKLNRINTIQDLIVITDPSCYRYSDRFGSKVHIEKWPEDIVWNYDRDVHEISAPLSARIYSLYPNCQTKEERFSLILEANLKYTVYDKVGLKAIIQREELQKMIRDELKNYREKRR